MILQDTSFQFSSIFLLGCYLQNKALGIKIKIHLEG